MLEPLIDISKFQSYPPIHFNWDIAKEKVYGAFIKCSDGLYTDVEFNYNWITSSAVYKPRGSYHIFRTSSYNPNYSIQQAEYYVSRLESLKNYGRPYGELELFADVETNDGNLNPSQYRSVLQAFLERLDELTGKSAGVYTRASFWDSYVSSGTHTKFADNRTKWIASYNNIKPYIPWDWKSLYGENCWDYWQWSADGNGMGAYYGSTGEKDIDLDRFNGTLESFNTKYNLSVNPFPEPEKTEKAICLVNGLRIRETHSTIAKIVGTLYMNDSPEVLEEYVNGNNIWVRIGWKQWSAMMYNGVPFMAYI